MICKKSICSGAAHPSHTYDISWVRDAIKSCVGLTTFLTPCLTRQAVFIPGQALFTFPYLSSASSSPSLKVPPYRKHQAILIPAKAFFTFSAVVSLKCLFLTMSCIVAFQPRNMDKIGKIFHIFPLLHVI
mmetsp:Transcript_16232/g.35084  ORF Transcript_16232/g.35084 Transcript_16232/m.35084 type:complete len:130 (-) Transcript_16232:1442-1831(-)